MEKRKFQLLHYLVLIIDIIYINTVHRCDKSSARGQRSEVKILDPPSGYFRYEHHEVNKEWLVNPGAVTMATRGFLKPMEVFCYWYDSNPPPPTSCLGYNRFRATDSRLSGAGISPGCGQVSYQGFILKTGSTPPTHTCTLSAHLQT